jgi:MFS family permease
LRQPVFRALWIATVISYIGTWMQDIAAAWLMTTLRPSPIMVSLITTANGIAIMLVALPAGALADVVDRRRLLLFAQSWMAAAAVALAVLALTGHASPWILIALTFVLSIGNALNAPAWSAIVPELVKPDELAPAIALNSVSFNLARAVGPALGGLIVASAGPATSFLLNAASFMGVIGVLYTWRRPRQPDALPAERLGGAMRSGLRYVRHAPALQAVLAHTGAFIVFASALWSLLALYAKDLLKQDATGYGTLLGFMGAGGLAGAACMPRLRMRLGVGGLVSISSTVFAMMLGLLAWTRSFGLACVFIALAGATWLLVLASLTVVAQVVVPGWVRARAMAVHLVVFFGGFAIGSALWGGLATRTGIPATLTCAAIGLLVSVPLMRRFPLRDEPPSRLEPARHWAAPRVVADPHPDRGPVLVTVTYEIDPARAEDFARAMQAVRRLRLRDGAIRWGLWHDAAQPGRVIESFVVKSWIEHLRQHERVTHADRDVQDQARAFHIGVNPPAVSHYIAEG